jgi:hypothetical protein
MNMSIALRQRAIGPTPHGYAAEIAMVFHVAAERQIVKVPN